MAGLLFALTLLGAIGAGLVVGIFFAFSAFVMTALGRLPAPNGVSAMQSINVAALNPAVLSVFFGTGLVSLAFGDRGFRQLVFTCKPLSPCRGPALHRRQRARHHHVQRAPQ
jgi:hypothetical protein